MAVRGLWAGASVAVAAYTEAVGYTEYKAKTEEPAFFPSCPHLPSGRIGRQMREMAGTLRRLICKCVRGGPRVLRHVSHFWAAVLANEGCYNQYPR